MAPVIFPLPRPLRGCPLSRRPSQAGHQINKAKYAATAAYVGAGDQTLNGRNNEMVREMKAFKDHVKLLHKELTDAGREVQGEMRAASLHAWATVRSLEGRYL